MLVGEMTLEPENKVSLPQPLPPLNDGGRGEVPPKLKAGMESKTLP